MLRNLLFRIGGLLLVLGALLPLFIPTVAPYIFALGALLFSYVQFTEDHRDDTLTIRRLVRQQMLGALLLLVTAALMFTSLYGLPPFRASEWKITLLIATVLELYTVFRIDSEMKKNK